MKKDGVGIGEMGRVLALKLFTIEKRRKKRNKI